ncbi:GNAT family N-acetyltransferase [Streptomyces sp. P9-2B-2]|uniref:GNAT family N-acetyltransferase n=1 Tax=Streptomyces sp. P9-2B-2 TaxID=3057114 RepID=UPI0025B55838|nr:GNAT family N-acetyltransferase [Streptomyces sp. P9-2B-2]WJY41155.1 GNAT family N-acetyltransferase [Streptomyces sp. P9-2B-2]
MAIEVLPVAGEQFGLLDAVIALGDRYTRFLGLVTPPAYLKHAEDGGLLAAVEDEEVVGYALFGLPKRNHYVRLAHLCVAEEHRGRGIARLLVEAIREQLSSERLLQRVSRSPQDRDIQSATIQRPCVQGRRTKPRDSSAPAQTKNKSPFCATAAAPRTSPNSPRHCSQLVHMKRHRSGRHHPDTGDIPSDVRA